MTFKVQNRRGKVKFWKQERIEKQKCEDKTSLASFSGKRRGNRAFTGTERLAGILVIELEEETRIRRDVQVPSEYGLSFPPIPQNSI